MIDPKNALKLTFHDGAETVTGVNLLLETPDHEPLRILFDCGLHQGEKIGDDQNSRPFPYDPSTIDVLFISHAHIDHTGRIPKLVKEGFKGVIYSTPPTKEIAELLLLDSIGILTKEARQNNTTPLYDEGDVEAAMRLWKTADYHEPIQINALSARFLDAGHVLGSSMTEITYRGKKLVYTGDLGNSPAPFLRDTEKLEDVDYLLMESVYGDRNHEHRTERKTLLEDVIEETVHRGGVLIVPAFSFERTQELLFEVKAMVESSRIPLVPVFLDSPLAINVTKVYEKYASIYFKKDDAHPAASTSLFAFPQLHMTPTTEESKAIWGKSGPKIIIAGSGMSNGGRIVHHEKKYLPDPKNTLLILGYQAVGTLGRLLHDGMKRVRISGEDVPVRAKVVSIGGYSAHKDSEHLVAFAADVADRVKQVFVILGEPKASLFLSQRIRDFLGVNARVPRSDEVVYLPLD